MIKMKGFPALKPETAPTRACAEHGQRIGSDVCGPGGNQDRRGQVQELGVFGGVSDLLAGWVLA